MPSGPLAFKESDVARALRAAVKADVGPVAVRIERLTGDILILLQDPVPPIVPPAEAEGEGRDDNLDAELAEWEQRQRA